MSILEFFFFYHSVYEISSEIQQEDGYCNLYWICTSPLFWVGCILDHFKGLTKMDNHSVFDTYDAI